MNANVPKKDYFLWLVDKVKSDSWEDTGSYWFLLKALYNKEFYWSVENDVNRSEDGKQLRLEYKDDKKLKDIPDVINGCCSVLEMLIGLARKWDETTTTDLEESKTCLYFWTMIGNLGLEGSTDDKFDPEFVDNLLDIFLDRGYASTGLGGLFPLKNCKDDQRVVEIWYQLQNYLMENYDF